MDVKSFLDRSLVIAFAFAPAGLGHLRVTSALYDGLPQEVTPILLGTQDKTITKIHHFLSNYPVLTKLMESVQMGGFENIVTEIYREVLRKRDQKVVNSLLSILDQRLYVPSKMIIVATHFGLAHQVAAIKEEVASKRHIEIKLVVVVTDDSPQKIWYVPGSDLTLVPSTYTKEKLFAYGRENSLDEIHMQVSSYPVSPKLGELLSSENQEYRVNQLNPLYKSKIEIAVPISGVAVGTDYIKTLMDELGRKNSRMVFHVIAKTSNYTRNFLDDLMERSFIRLHTASHDRQIVNTYEEVYKSSVISLELTKPSEQAFKALLCPSDIGGSVILFLNPVGRQEYDNLNFLKRHRLIPNDQDMTFLINKASSDIFLNEKEKLEILNKAKTWRGIIIPSNPKESAQLIEYLYKERILYHMADAKNPCVYSPLSHDELGSDGVAKFWNIISEKFL